MSGELEQIPVFDVRVTDEDVAAVEEVLRAGWLSMGPRVERFEAEFAAAIGTEHCVALSSCTAALHLACIACDIGPGDEVIVPSMTFAATANAVRYVGATPIFADVVSDTDLGMDADLLEGLIGPRTKAVLPVHYAGYAVDIERIRAICDERGIFLIEDSAHAPSARPGPGQPKLGSYGIAGCFSFFPNKVLGVGEGGALCTDDAEFADRIRRLRSQGMTATSIDRFRGAANSYDVAERGYNYRMDEPRAALLSSRLARLEDELVARRALIARYREAFADLEEIPVVYRDYELEHSSCYLMGIVARSPEHRRFLRRRLTEEHSVQTTMYPAIHLFTAYREAYGEISIPRTERAADGLFSIPLFPHMEDAQLQRVIDAVRESVGAYEPGAEPGGPR